MSNLKQKHTHLDIINTIHAIRKLLFMYQSVKLLFSFYLLHCFYTLDSWNYYLYVFHWKRKNTVAMFREIWKKRNLFCSHFSLGLHYTENYNILQIVLLFVDNTCYCIETIG